MLQITPHHRILLATEPVDFRKGIDGFQALCRQTLAQDPLSGTVFVFCSRSRTAVKLLVYDGNGFWLCHKRFSSGRLAFWPKSTQAAASLRASQLAVLLAQGNPSSSSLPEDWRTVAAA